MTRDPSVGGDAALNDALVQPPTARHTPIQEGPLGGAQSGRGRIEATVPARADEAAAGSWASIAGLLRRLDAAGGAIRLLNGRIEVRDVPPLLREELIEREADLLGFFSPADQAAPSVLCAFAHRRRLGWSVEQFGALCRRLIGKPGPSTWDEDCRVAAELARIPTPTTTSPSSATTFAEERPLRGGPAVAANVVPTSEVSLLSVANRYRALFGTSIVAALHDVTGCDFNERNPTHAEVMHFATWMDASAPRSVVGTEASSIPQAGNTGEGHP